MLAPRTDDELALLEYPMLEKKVCAPESPPGLFNAVSDEVREQRLQLQEMFSQVLTSCSELVDGCGMLEASAGCRFEINEQEFGWAVLVRPLVVCTAVWGLQ